MLPTVWRSNADDHCILKCMLISACPQRHRRSAALAPCVLPHARWIPSAVVPADCCSAVWSRRVHVPSPTSFVRERASGGSPCFRRATSLPASIPTKISHQCCYFPSNCTARASISLTFASHSSMSSPRRLMIAFSSEPASDK